MDGELTFPLSRRPSEMTGSRVTFTSQSALTFTPGIGPKLMSKLASIDIAARIRRRGTVSRANTPQRIPTSVMNITDPPTGIEGQRRYLHRMAFCRAFRRERTSGRMECLTWTTTKQLTNAFQVQEPRLQRHSPIADGIYGFELPSTLLPTCPYPLLQTAIAFSSSSPLGSCDAHHIPPSGTHPDMRQSTVPCRSFSLWTWIQLNISRSGTQCVPNLQLSHLRFGVRSASLLRGDPTLQEQVSQKEDP